MSYQVINEQLGIQSCDIEDLSEETKAEYAKNYENEKIETLTMIYNPTTDILTLNHNHKDFELFKLVAETYLDVSEEERRILRENIPDSISETIQMLDKVLKMRLRIHADEIALEINKMIDRQKIGPYVNQYPIIEELRKINKNRDDSLIEYAPFMFGYIQGIRAERARRKKVRNA